MSGKLSEVPVKEREGRELGGKEREQPQTLDMTRVQAQAGDKRTREERSPTGLLSSPDVVAPPSKRTYNQTDEGRTKKSEVQREHARLGTGGHSKEAQEKRSEAKKERARLGIGEFSREAQEKSKKSKERKYAPTKADIYLATGMKNKYDWMNQSSKGASGSGSQS